MRGSLLAATIATTAVFGCYASSGIAQDDTDQKFGTVHFATSCNETAQRRFDRAMRYQHSFWYRDPRKYSRKRSRPIRNAVLLIGV